MIREAMLTKRKCSTLELLANKFNLEDIQKKICLSNGYFKVTKICFYVSMRIYLLFIEVFILDKVKIPVILYFDLVL